MRLKLSVVCAAFVLIAGCQSSPPPNVVVVLIDTLRPDHLELYGYERETAPFLNQLGRDGSVFVEAFSSSSWTAPSTASLFTGLYPNHHGVDMGLMAYRNARRTSPEGENIKIRRLPESISTLPEILQGHGYRTFGFAANVNVGSEIGFDRGMDRFHQKRRQTAEGIVTRLSQWADEIDASEPHFVYIHLNDVHWPYTPERRWFPKSSDSLSNYIARYDSEIRYVDTWLERIVERFVDDETLLVVLSDHGEEFREHGRIRHAPSLYRELNQILLLFHSRGLGIPAKAVTTPVSIVDVLPTILDVAGLPVPKGRDGLSLVRSWQSDDKGGGYERPLFAERLSGDGSLRIWSVLRGPWKLIQKRGNNELYHRAADPDEQNNVAIGHAEVTRELSELLDRHRSTTREHSAQAEVSADAELLEDLRTLGYVK